MHLKLHEVGLCNCRCLMVATVGLDGDVALLSVQLVVCVAGTVWVLGVV